MMSQRAGKVRQGVELVKLTKADEQPVATRLRTRKPVGPAAAAASRRRASIEAAAAEKTVRKVATVAKKTATVKKDVKKTTTVKKAAAPKKQAAKAKPEPKKEAKVKAKVDEPKASRKRKVAVEEKPEPKRRKVAEEEKPEPKRKRAVKVKEPEKKVEPKKQRVQKKKVPEVEIEAPVEEEKAPVELPMEERPAEVELVEEKTEAPLNCVVFVAGNGEMGELGLGADIREAPKPVSLKSLKGFPILEVVAGGCHSAALMTDGKVWTWGVNDDFQCGREQEPPEEDYDFEDELWPGPIVKFVDAEGNELGDKKIVQVALGNAHTVLLDSEGEVFSLGCYKTEQGSIVFDNSGKKQNFAKLLNFGQEKIVSIAAGEEFDLAVDNKGSIYEWGARVYEKSANGSVDPNVVYVPKQIQTKFSAVKVFAGPTSSRFCLMKNGDVYTWGLNASGQLGRHPESADETLITPSIVKNLSGISVKKISAGQRHGVALTEEGEVLVWGMNENGQLGLGKADDKSVKYLPTKLNVPFKAIDVTAGVNHTIIIGENRKVIVFGSNTSNHLGLNLDVDGNAQENAEVFDPRDLTVPGNLQLVGAAGSSQFSIFLGDLNSKEN